MEKNNKPKKLNSNEKLNLTSEVQKWGAIFAISVNLILQPGNILGNSIDINKVDNNDDSSEVFYKALVNEMSFTMKGFIETIKEQTPEFIFQDSNLKKHEKIILNYAHSEIKNHRLQHSYRLSKGYINSLSLDNIKISLIYLLDAMYGVGYSSILTDGGDHSDKKLVFDISLTDDGPRIRKLSIEDIK